MIISFLFEEKQKEKLFFCYPHTFEKNNVIQLEGNIFSVKHYIFMYYLFHLWEPTEGYSKGTGTGLNIIQISTILFPDYRQAVSQYLSLEATW